RTTAALVLGQLCDVDAHAPGLLPVVDLPDRACRTDHQGGECTGRGGHDHLRHPYRVLRAFRRPPGVVVGFTVRSLRPAAHRTGSLRRARPRNGAVTALTVPGPLVGARSAHS